MQYYHTSSFDPIATTDLLKQGAKSIAYVINESTDLSNLKYYPYKWVNDFSHQETKARTGIYHHNRKGLKWHTIAWNFPCNGNFWGCGVPSDWRYTIQYSYDLSLNYLCYQDRNKTNQFELQLPWIDNWSQHKNKMDSGPRYIYDINVKVFCDKSVFGTDTSFSCSWNNGRNYMNEDGDNLCFEVSYTDDDEWDQDDGHDTMEKYLIIYGESSRYDIFDGNHSIYSGNCSDIERMIPNKVSNLLCTHFNVIFVTYIALISCH